MSLSSSLIIIALSSPMIRQIQAEAHCPGNAASLRFPANSSAKIIVPVKINQAGPYDFVVDTATQVTSMDPALASELHLNLEGEVGIIPILGEGKEQSAYSLLPPQDLRIGHRYFNHVQFAIPAKVARDLPLLDEDGVLPTALFQSVFISFANRYITLDPNFRSSRSPALITDNSRSRTSTSVNRK